jgi:hypothetical protein
MPGVPDSSKELLLRLLEEEPLPVEALKAGVETYRRLIHKVAAENGRANAPLGDEIAKALQAILARMSDRTGWHNHVIIQSGVRYFVIQNDGFGNDLATEDGLFDDARIVNAILHYFGLDKLKIDIPIPAADRRQPPPRR